MLEINKYLIRSVWEGQGEAKVAGMEGGEGGGCGGVEGIGGKEAGMGALACT